MRPTTTSSSHIRAFVFVYYIILFLNIPTLRLTSAQPSDGDICEEAKRKGRVDDSCTECKNCATNPPACNAEYDCHHGSVVDDPEMSPLTPCNCNVEYKSSLCCDAGFCINGGKMINNGSCACNANFTGTFCEFVAKCYHGGHVAHNRRICVCPEDSHYYGDLCQEPQCFQGHRDGPESCKCDSPYHGVYCERITCKHGTEHPSYFKPVHPRCDCPRYWRGRQCGKLSILGVLLFIIVPIAGIAGILAVSVMCYRFVKKSLPMDFA